MKITDFALNIKRILKFAVQIAVPRKADENPSLGGRLRALIVYVTKQNGGVKHSNQQELQQIIAALETLGYMVDICDYWTNYRQRTYSEYDLFFGFGDLFEDICTKKNQKQISIYYATTAYLPFQNNAEIQRCRFFRDKTGVWIQPKRNIDRSWPASLNLSDAIYLIGNEWTKSTYPQWAQEKILLIKPTSNAPCLNIDQDLQKFNCRLPIAWIGSSGCLHKGLDLVLDFALTNEDCQLDIFGNNYLIDPEFCNYIESVRTTRIRAHGQVDFQDDSVRSVVHQCKYAILPSCSEGTATSILAAVQMGLFPIVSKECGIPRDIACVQMDQLSQSAIHQAINHAESIPLGQMKELRLMNQRTIENSYSIRAFSLDMFNKLDAQTALQRKII